jgi:hypothetical protein
MPMVYYLDFLSIRPLHILGLLIRLLLTSTTRGSLHWNMEEAMKLVRCSLLLQMLHLLTLMTKRALEGSSACCTEA